MVEPPVGRATYVVLLQLTSGDNCVLQTQCLIGDSYVHVGGDCQSGRTGENAQLIMSCIRLVTMGGIATVISHFGRVGELCDKTFDTEQGTLSIRIVSLFECQNTQ